MPAVSKVEVSTEWDADPPEWRPDAARTVRQLNSPYRASASRRSSAWSTIGSG